MNFYIALCPRSKIIAIERYGSSEQSAEGSIRRAAFALAGMLLRKLRVITSLLAALG